MSTPGKLLTLSTSPRKRAANRVRRLRGELSREAFVELLRERGVDVSARALGDIERGLARMTALEIVEALEAKNSQYRDGEAAPTVLSGPSLIRCDTGALPAACSCGSRASDQAAAADDGRVVSLTAGIPNARRAA